MAFHNWSDDPIDDKSQDTLDRSAYAERLASLIGRSFLPKSSTVFGLVGSWGSGKTSILKLVEKELNGAGDYEVVWFTPWAANDVDGILADFYGALSTALPRKNRRRARRAFASMLRLAAPATNLLPAGGTVASSAVTATADALAKTPPWSKAFADASNEVVKARRRILVIVDDIDRLQGNELLSVLKVVRLLGRFPGVQYLLAYDHESLSHTLMSIGAARNLAEAARFIEKIVQHPTPVPALVAAQLIRRLSNGMETIFSRRRPELSSPLKQNDYLLPIVTRLLTTPRAVDRYLALLDYELGVHKPGEVNDDDVAAIAVLRCVNPALVTRLPQYEYELTSGMQPNSSRAFEREDAKFSVDTLLSDLDSPSHELPELKRLLNEIFPKTSESVHLTRPRGVGDQNYFKRYFAMGILSEHDLADSDVVIAIRSALGGNVSDLESMLCSDDVALALVAFTKLEAFFRAAVQEVQQTDRDSALLTFLAGFLAIIRKLPEGGSNAIFGLSDMLPRWAGNNVISALSDEVDADDVVNSMSRAGLEAQIIAIRDTRIVLSQRPAWWERTLALLMPAVQAALVQHFSERDHASVTRDDLFHFMDFANQAGVDLDPVRQQVEDCIERDEFTIEDVAARFSTRENSGSTFGFRQADFELVAPMKNYPWYSELGHLPTRDRWGWPERRAVAKRLAEPPSMLRESDSSI